MDGLHSNDCPAIHWKVMSRAYNRIRSIYISFLVGLLICGAAEAKLDGTSHDLGGSICDKCHTPRGNTPMESPQWNRQSPVQVRFSMYDSPTPSAPGEGQPHGVSLVCLSCHDGVTSDNVLVKRPQPLATRQLAGITVTAGRHNPSNFHPVSVTYNWMRNPEINVPRAKRVGDLPLFRSPESEAVFNHVECASCHNPHDTRYGRYLRVDNEGSALCLTCHIK